MKKIFYILVLLVPYHIYGQINLIPNNSFEVFDSCELILAAPIDSHAFTTGYSKCYVEGCFPKNGLVQLINECSIEFEEWWAPHSGESFLTFNNFSHYNTYTNTIQRNSEQLTIVLNQETKKDQWYYLEYWVSSIPQNIFLDRVFRNTSVYFTNVFDYIPYNHWNDINMPKTVHFADTTTIIDATGWKKISGCFQLDSAYKYMIGFNSVNPDFFPFITLAFFNDIQMAVDDVILTPIDTFLEVSISLDTLCPGDCIEIASNHSLIDAIFDWDLPGSDYNWQDTGFVQVCYMSEGVYDIGLMVDHCAGTYQKIWSDKVVVMNPPDQIALDSQHVQIIEGETVDIGCSEGGSVVWDITTGLEIDGLTAIATDSVLEDTLYTCTFGEGSQCSFSCSYTFEILHYPQAAFDVESNIICEGECFYIEDKSQYTDGDVQYLLSGTSTEEGVFTEVLEICPNAGTYTLSMIVENEIGQDTVFIDLLYVYPYPEEIMVQENTLTVEAGDTVTLYNPYEGESLWTSEIDAVNGSTNDTLVFVAENPGVITLVAHQYEECSLSQDFEIIIEYIPESIFFPTGFTPNDDGRNDTWQPYYSDGIEILEITIYDRTGFEVFHTDDESNLEWTGYTNGHQN